LTECELVWQLAAAVYQTLAADSCVLELAVALCETAPDFLFLVEDK